MTAPPVISITLKIMAVSSGTPLWAGSEAGWPLAQKPATLSLLVCPIT